MQRLQNISKRILATFSFFTRLPVWRLTTIDKCYYERVVPLWPLAGWLTGGLMAVVFLLATMLGFTTGIAVALALISRVLLTGALHEDGFADFCDGFGGGTDRESVLRIMKDSHIGTYGVLGLVLYYLLAWSTMCAIAIVTFFPLVMIAADVVSKYFSSYIIYFLPYARKAEDAKNKLVYSCTTLTDWMVSTVLGLLPMVLLIVFIPDLFPSALLCFVACAICCLILFFFMHKRIHGYTGDCCGACFILTELVFYLSFYIVLVHV